MFSRKKILLLIMLINTISVLNLKGQNTINSSINDSTYSKIRIKLNSKIFLGELPLNFEFRFNKKLGIDFSVNYIFLSYIPGSDKLSSSGLKIFSGIKIYFNKNELKKRTFYLFPNIFYKQIYSDNRYYSEDDPFLSGGGNNYDRYYYNLTRSVKAFSILAGWDFEKNNHIFELYFGLGIRQIKDIRDITKWQTISYKTNQNPLPTNEIDVFYSPSIHFGFCWSFDITQLFVAKNK